MFGLVQHPWFQPLHRRIGTALLPLIGAAVEVFFDNEAAGGSSLWTTIWLALFAYAAYGFFLSGYYRDASRHTEGDTTDGGG